MKRSDFSLVMLFIAIAALAACGPLEEEQNPIAVPTVDGASATQQISELQTAAAAPPATSAAEPGSMTTGEALSELTDSILWTRQFGTSLTDEIGDVILDQLGNVFVTCLCSLGSPQPFDSPFTPSGAQVVGRAPTVLKFNEDGHLAWQIGLDTGSFSPDAPVATVDNAGNLISAVSDYVDQFSLLVKNDGDGNEVWKVTLQGIAINDVATDLDGDIYIVGREWLSSDTRPRSYLRKFDGDGQALWVLSLDSENAEVNGLTVQVHVSPNGKVLVAGSMWGDMPGATSLGGADMFIRGYTLVGEEVWTRQFGSARDDYIQDAAIDVAASIYAVYENGQPVLEKFDDSGEPVWSKQLERPGTDWARLAVDNDENLYVLLNHNWPGDPSDAELRRFDAMGIVIWTRGFPAAWPAIVELIAIDSNGHVYLGGGTVGALPGQTDSGNYDVFILMMEIAE
ncbi:MAG: hypothetical protein WEA61_07865 [Anaerolineales bacterium]